MNYKRIDSALAKKIIEHNPHLPDKYKNILIEVGLMIKDRISEVLENTPDLTEDEIQLIQQNGLKMSRRTGLKRNSLPPVSEEVRAKIVQQMIEKQESDPNYMKRQNSRPQNQAQQNISEENNTDNL